MQVRLHWLIFTRGQEGAEGMVCPGFPAGRGTRKGENLEQILDKIKGSGNCSPRGADRPQSLEYSPSIQFET